MSDLRGLLEEIAFGQDPGISIDHRLRAAESLRTMGAGDEPYEWSREFSEVSDDELDTWSDCAAASVFTSSSYEERTKRFPELMRVIEDEVERRVGETVRASAGAGRYGGELVSEARFT